MSGNFQDFDVNNTIEINFRENNWF